MMLFGHVKTNVYVKSDERRHDEKDRQTVRHIRDVGSAYRSRNEVPEQNERDLTRCDSTARYWQMVYKQVKRLGNSPA
jgi:hypothetical protein